MEQEERKRLLVKGRQIPIAALLEQGRSHAVLARAHEDDLQDEGWFKEETDALESRIEALDTLCSNREERSLAAKGATVKEAKCRQAAKSFIRKIRRAVPMVLRKHKVEDITRSTFNAGENLGRSTPKISKYLTKIRPAVRALDEYLKPRFNGQSPSEILESLKSDLDQTDATQEFLRAGLPERTAHIYLKAGELLDLIEELNVAGKDAYDAEAETAAKFNKDLILRATRKSGRNQPEQPESES